MNLPNKLTILRIILVFVFMYLLFIEGVIFKVAAFLVFLIAAITDYYDGKIAREKNLVTNLGKILDPIADKLLTMSAFLAFVQMNIIPAWMVIIIIARELVITSLRLLAATFHIIIPAAKSGKHKTVSQMVSILIILIILIVKDFGLMNGFWSARVDTLVGYFIYIIMLITVFLTALSGISFLYKYGGSLLNVKDR